ncbi:phasin family protein [uncultured Hymenobacter sp.]|uniref:phasin family protein n=1 Tax=uncultured Hymenobacter sp. TaxID=170016 RepID=UPI0035C94A01
MEDLFKKFINAGIGFVSLTTDRVQKTIDTLVQESKLSEQEGAKIMDELKQNGETKRKELEKQVQSIASRVMKTVGVAPNSEVEELKRTVKGGSKPAPAAPKAAAPKAAPKAGKPTVNSTVGYTNVSSAEGAAAAAQKTVTNPATSSKGSKVKSAGSKSNPNSKEEKANIQAAKKAISPNDNTSSTGSTLS